MDLKNNFSAAMETYELNRELFRLRGKHNGANIGDGEINLLAHIIRLHTNNFKTNEKNYCGASNAYFRDYLFLPQNESGLKTVKERLKKLKTAGFITTNGKTINRQIYVDFSAINDVINGVLAAEPTLEEKKEISRQQSQERQTGKNAVKAEIEDAPNTKPKKSAGEIIKSYWNPNAPEDTNIKQCQIWLDYALSGEEIMEIAYNLGLRSYKPNKKIYTDPEYGFEEMDGEDCPF